MNFGGFPAKCLMLPIYATIDAAVKNGGTNSSNPMGTGAPNGYVPVRTQTQSSIDDCDQASEC
jgi:hypothetical protein